MPIGEVHPLEVGFVGRVCVVIVLEEHVYFGRICVFDRVCVDGLSLPGVRICFGSVPVCLLGICVMNECLLSELQVYWP